ncbi:MAG TPA: glycine--tRNA ligase subunit beta [Kofleriaceae bacterium]|nr:glycine--tRNA ligase subunit beta [Kofleriaceae bacterium]
MPPDVRSGSGTGSASSGAERGGEPGRDSEGGRELLLEVGTEEIPAGFLARALSELPAAVAEALAGARLAHGAVQVWGTPRRIAFAVADLAARQPDLSERVVGPPVSAAFDKAGNPTRAALAFAEKNGADPAGLERTEVSGKKGEYVVCTRREPGRPALEVLPGLLARLLGAIAWPKVMRWGGGEHAFVRPVHWLVAIHGGEVVALEFCGVRAGRTTRGHRFLGPAAVELDGSAAGYLAALRQAHVIVDPERRRTMIVAELARIEKETGARVRRDDALLDEVTFLVEYPVAVCGEFERSFLEVPEEVVVSAMRAHQRYFAMEDAGGRLASRFVTVAGTVVGDVAVVRHGNERVLAARLADAQFFFREDQKHTPDQLAARAGGVVFQKKLGSVGQKVERIGELAGWIAAQVGAGEGAVARAAALSKFDLASAMVGEFPDLQGTMGRRYAELAGEDAAVALAVAEHYMPRGGQGEPPSSVIGSIVGLADRLDTLLRCFDVGLAPTGSADPYGLRRAALGILRILVAREWRLPLSQLLARAAAPAGGLARAGDATRAQALEFLRTRLRGQLVEVDGLAPDCADAALAAGFDDVPDARARAAALSRLRARADFEPLAAAFKRVANILKGEAPAIGDGLPDPAAFVEDDERALWASFNEIRGRVESRLGEGDYSGALQVLAELKAPVDRFFDKVLVMDQDQRVRSNRLALLGRINATFTRIADFRQLSV